MASLPLDPAVLREVTRLRPGRPWTPAALEEVLERDPHAEERARAEAAIAAARREVERNIRLLKLIEEPDDETLAAFRRDNQALDQRIKSCKSRTLPVGVRANGMAVDQRSGRVFVINGPDFVIVPDSWAWLPAWLRRRLPLLPPGRHSRPVPSGVTMIDPMR